MPIDNRLSSPRARTVVVAWLLAAGLAAATPASAMACGGAQARAGHAARSSLAATTVCLINRQRAANGLGALHSNRALARAGARHAQYMVRNRYFSHYARSGYSFSDWIRAAGYLSGARSWSVGEAIAWGQAGRGSPGAIVSAWMHSPEHRAILLARGMRDIGIGVAVGAPTAGAGGSATYAAEVGRR